MQANMSTREKESTYDQYGQGSLALLSRLLFEVLGVEFLKILKVVGAYRRRSETSKYKQINKKYTKQYVMTKQAGPTDATHHYECVSVRIT
jgi:hypothetical protein